MHLSYNYLIYISHEYIHIYLHTHIYVVNSIFVHTYSLSGSILALCSLSCLSLSSFLSLALFSLRTCHVFCFALSPNCSIVFVKLHNSSLE